MEDDIFERAPEQTVETEEMETRIKISLIPMTEQAKGMTRDMIDKAKSDFGKERECQLIDPLLIAASKKSLKSRDRVKD